MEPIDPGHIPPKTVKHSYLESLLLGPMTPKRVILLTSILIGAIVIAGISFWLGFRHDTSAQWVLAPTPTPGQEISVSETPEVTPEPTEIVDQDPTPSPTRRATPTKTPTQTPAPTLTSTPSHTPSPTVSPTPTTTPTPSLTPTTIPTDTVTPAITATVTPTETVTPTP